MSQQEHRGHNLVYRVSLLGTRLGQQVPADGELSLRPSLQFPVEVSKYLIARYDDVPKFVVSTSAYNAPPDVKTFHGEPCFICDKTKHFLALFEHGKCGMIELIKLFP